MNIFDMYGRTTEFTEKAAEYMKEAITIAYRQGQLKFPHAVSVNKDAINPALIISFPTDTEGMTIYIDAQYDSFKKKRSSVEEAMKDKCSETIVWLQEKEKELKEEIASWEWQGIETENEEELE